MLLATPFAAGVAQAQDMKPGELLDEQAKPLSKAELDALMPGANVTTEREAGAFKLVIKK